MDEEKEKNEKKKEKKRKEKEKNEKKRLACRVGSNREGEATA